MSELQLNPGVGTFAEKFLDRMTSQLDKGASGPVADVPGVEKFSETLKKALGEVNSAIKNSDKAIQDFSTGRAENLHDVLIAVEKADISLRTLQAVRGKVVEAYQEIMRMPV